MTSDSPNDESAENTISIDDGFHFHQYIAKDMLRQYFNSIIMAESSTKKALGEESHEFMSFTAALEEIAKKALEESDGDLSLKEDDQDMAVFKEGPLFNNPELMTKVQIRSSASKIRDLKRKWQGVELDDVHPTTIISTASLEDSIQKLNRVYINPYDASDIDPDELTGSIGNMVDVGIFREYGTQMYRRRLSESVIPFYLLYQTYIDEMTVEKINECLIDEQYAGSNGTYEMIDNISQPTREELLERTGCLEPHFVSMMCENRRVRNSLVHSLYGRGNFDIMEEAAEEIGRCEKVLSAMDSSEFSWMSQK